MTDAQIHRFIFRAGFSTAAVVTAVSGRGVGMDVVKTNIERIGGTIELKSAAGQGTTFLVKIPLTLAIVSALIVQAGRERFAIPQISVVELVRAAGSDGAAAADRTESRIERINGTPVLRLRDRLLPLVSLAGLLRLEHDAGAERRPASASWSPRSAPACSASSSTGCSTPRRSWSSRWRRSCATSPCSAATPSWATAR